MAHVGVEFVPVNADDGLGRLVVPEFVRVCRRPVSVLFEDESGFGAVYPGVVCVQFGIVHNYSDALSLS